MDAGTARPRLGRQLRRIRIYVGSRKSLRCAGL